MFKFHSLELFNEIHSLLSLTSLLKCHAEALVIHIHMCCVLSVSPISAQQYLIIFRAKLILLSVTILITTADIIICCCLDLLVSVLLLMLGP